MKAIILASAAVIATAAAPSSASILTIGGSYARACYDAAEARNSSPESVENCDMAFAIQPLDADDIVATHVNRGIIHMIRGDHVRARADFDTALALNPQQPEAWLNKGILIFDEGDSRAASQLAEKALSLNTRRPAIALYIRALANEDQGNVKAAYADLLKSAELAPAWSPPQRELKRYRVVR